MSAKKTAAAVLPALSALVLTLLLGASGILASLDRAWFDTLQRSHADRAPLPTDTAIVLIDEQSLRALGAEPYTMRWPWPRRAFAGLFAALDRAGAKHILADFIFFENSSDATDDALLASTSAAIPTVTLGAMRGSNGLSGMGVSPMDGEAARSSGKGILPVGSSPLGFQPVHPQLPIFWPAEYRAKHAPFFAHPRWGYVNATADPDGILRRYHVRNSLAAAASDSQISNLKSEIHGGSAAVLRYRGNLEHLKTRGVPVLPAAPFVAEGLQILNRAIAQIPDSDFENPASLARALSAQPALTHDLFARVRGRTVLVGVNAAGTFDAIATPVGAPEPGVLVHWTALADIRSGTFLRETPAPATLAAISLSVLLISFIARGFPFSLFTLHTSLFPTSSPWRTALATALLITLALTGSTTAFAHASLWFAPATTVTAALASFAAETTSCFLRERAHKREIQNWFGAYVSPTVVKNLIHNPGSIRLGGERRELTVFFSDIAGFTTISERLPTEQLVALINTYLQELSECVLKHGCYLDKYIGDAIMAVFGAPEPLENHALSACRAALDSQRRLSEINDRLERDYDARIGIRIGVNTGEMIVGNVGSEKKKNYTVLGDAVNLGARLESANKEFGTGILIGPITAQRVASHLATRPVGMLRVKGKNTAVAVHELIGETAMLTEPQRLHIELCTAGHEAWCARRFPDAIAAYERALTLSPTDRLSAQYLEAARTHAANPPPPDWLPILELHSK